MSGDLRGFVYALEPLLRQRQWRVDGAQARLGQLQREMDGVVQALRALEETRRESSEAATRAFMLAGDCQAHARCLQWLAHLQDRCVALESRLRQLHDNRRALREECRHEQRRLEAIEAHRDDAAQGHLREEGARLAAEADRDWLVRAAVDAIATSTAMAGGTSA